MTIVVCPLCGVDYVTSDGLPDVEEELCPDCAGEDVEQREAEEGERDE